VIALLSWANTADTCNQQTEGRPDEWDGFLFLPKKVFRCSLLNYHINCHIYTREANNILLDLQERGLQERSQP